MENNYISNRSDLRSWLYAIRHIECSEFGGEGGEYLWTDQLQEAGSLLHTLTGRCLANKCSVQSRARVWIWKWFIYK